MKVFMINPKDERFEAEIVRFFQNVNDRYVVYTIGEKDSNGFQVVYAMKIANSNGIRVGSTITDENEWVLVKNFIKETVNQNKNGQPLTIVDVNPAELAELKIESVRAFKLQAAVVDLFSQNQKSFEIVQTVQTVAPAQVPQEVEQVIAPAPVLPVEPVAPVHEEVVPAPLFTAPVAAPVAEQTFEKTTVTLQEPTVVPADEPNNYKTLYEEEVKQNKELSKELESLMHDYVDLKAKFEQIKELVG